MMVFPTWMLWLGAACQVPLPGKKAEVFDAELEVETSAYSVQILVPEEGHLLQCEHTDDDREIHRQATDPGNWNGVHGLLADTSYRCTVEDEGGTLLAGAVVETNPTPPTIPQMELTVAGDMVGAYTLFNHLEKGRDPNRQKLLIVDPEGKVRFHYDLPYKASGDIDVRFLSGDRILYGGGYGGRPHIIDLDLSLLFRGSATPSGGRYHHHVEPGPGEAELYSLVTSQNEGNGHGFTGFAAELLDMDSNEILWSWDSQAAIDQGILTPGSGDPFHANWMGVTEEDDGERLWVNMRNNHKFCRILMGTGEVEWCLGPGEDFSLVDEAGMALGEDQWFYHQHAPELHGDTVFFYDNGTARPGGHYSRILEMRLDLVEMTATPVWTWTEPDWVEPIWGDVDVLGDHLLITRAHCVDCVRAEDGLSALIELDKATGDVVWRLEMSELVDGLYRSERLGGCEVFHNTRWCDREMP